VGQKVLIIAGEVSGDLHGANLVKAMASVDPSISFRGVGAGYMRQAGVELLWDAAEMAVVGISEVLRHLKTILRVFRIVTATLRDWRPDLVILIDYPEFNLIVAGRARKLGIPVMYYISPQLWAWRPGRIKTVRRRVDRMVVILPFEEALYQQAGVNVSFVGHPLLDLITERDEAEVERSRYVDRQGGPLLGLLPGSRVSELSKLLPVMLDAAEILLHRIDGVHFLLPLAPGIRREQVAPLLQDRDLPLTLVDNNTHEIIQMCELVIAASGTVTLEAAILGTPLVVVYKVSPLTYRIGKRLLRVKQVALANLVADQPVAPELLQHEATPERIAAEAMGILEDSRRRGVIRERLRKIRRKLGAPGASRRAAAIALAMMGKRRPGHS
jgi:lipid-A-disaccharide synthase